MYNDCCWDGGAVVGIAVIGTTTVAAAVGIAVVGVAVVGVAVVGGIVMGAIVMGGIVMGAVVVGAVVVSVVVALGTMLGIMLGGAPQSHVSWTKLLTSPGQTLGSTRPSKPACSSCPHVRVEG